jgi:hypothetical protein
MRHRHVAAGDLALGYDLANTSMVGLDVDAFIAKGGSHGDVMLVRKSYQETRRKRNKTSRAWKLKQLEMAAGEDEVKNRGEEQLEKDRERFMEVSGCRVASG